MERWQNKVAVVTGASSGIGAEIALDLAKAGIQVIGIARRNELIEELAKKLPEQSQHLLKAIKCDVSQLESINKVFDSIIETYGGVDILVYSAARHELGRLIDLDPLILENTMNVNVMGAVYCTQRAFKSMQERDFNGHIFFINGSSGHTVYHKVPTPDADKFLNFASPLKHTLKVMTEIFRREFTSLGSKVKITSISPGVVDTPLIKKLVSDQPMDWALTPSDVSNAVLYALSTPPKVQIHELMIQPMGDMF